jgi:hypothetical protein
MELCCHEVFEQRFPMISYDSIADEAEVEVEVVVVAVVVVVVWASKYF